MKNHHSTCRCKGWVTNTTPGYAEHVRRLEFVNAVCGLLIESRFGPGAHYDPIVELSDRFYFCSEPDYMPDEYFDLTWRWPVPGQAVLSLIGQTTGMSTVAASTGRRAMDVSLSPLALARGLPNPAPEYFGVTGFKMNNKDQVLAGIENQVDVTPTRRF